MHRTRTSYIVWWLVVLVLYLSANVTARAHSPYLDQKGLRTLLSEDGRRYQVGTLYGDGILFPDPGRPVLLNDQGLVVALGPRAGDGIVRCANKAACAILLDNGEKIVPDPKSFGPPRIPNFYPEHETVEYGFAAARWTLVDHLVSWTAVIQRYPPWAAAGSTMFIGLGALTAWVVRRAHRNIAIQGVSLGSAIVWTLGSASLLVITAIALLALEWLSGSIFTLRPMLFMLTLGVIAGFRLVQFR